MAIEVLFVDDESMLLAGLRRRLRPMAGQWTMRFADSGAGALDQLHQHPADVVVSDIRMPGMDGVELLSRVRDQYPNTLRVALSGQTELAQALAAVSVAHRFLNKPCDALTVQTTVAQLIEVRERITGSHMQAFITSTGALPASPVVVDRLNAVLLDPEASTSAISDAVSADPALTAHLLELANSMLLSAGKPAQGLPEAVTVLGPDLVRDLATGTAALTAFTTSSQPLATMAAELERHSLAVASLAARIAGEPDTGPAFSAGILHDIGLLVLATRAPEQGSEIDELVARGDERLDAEKAVLGITHAQIGSHLLAFWGLPSSLCEAVAQHHDAPATAPWTMNPTHAVYLAETLLTRMTDHRTTGADAISHLDPAYLEALDVTDRLTGLARTAAGAVTG